MTKKKKKKEKIMFPKYIPDEETQYPGLAGVSVAETLLSADASAT